MSISFPLLVIICHFMHEALTYPCTDFIILENVYEDYYVLYYC
jgi:hypothetical protein